MVKHENSSNKNANKKKNMVVNLGKGGGAGGVIFLGGIIVTGIVSSVLAIKKKKHKSTSDMLNNHKTSPSVQSFEGEDETQGLQFLVPNCCPDENQQLRNGKTGRVLRKGSSVTCLLSAEKICKDGAEVEIDLTKQCPTVLFDQLVEDHRDMLVDSEGNDHGNVRDLEDRELQMDEGEKPSSSLALEGNYELIMVQSSSLDQKLSNMGSLVYDEDHVQVMEGEEKTGTTTKEDDKEKGELQVDEDINEKCDEFNDHEITKPDVEVPNTGEIRRVFAHSGPGNRIQDVSSPSKEVMDPIEEEDVAMDLESPDEKYMIEDEANLRMLSMVSQQYDDLEISPAMDIDETSDTSSAEANRAVPPVYDLIEKLSEENDPYEDDEVFEDDGSHHSTEEVEDSSEGTIHSSADSNSEAIWPTETIQETEPDKCNVEKINIERLISKEQMEHNEEVNFNLTFKTRNGNKTTFIVDWYSLHLNSMKWIILLGTLLAFCCIGASHTIS